MTAAGPAGRPAPATVVVAPDKFKGSLTAAQAATRISAGLRRAVPGCDIRPVPVADGGDGLLDAVLAAGFRERRATVHGPLGDPVSARFAVRGAAAVIELAEASGLRRLPAGRPPDEAPDENAAALRADSYGTGELLLAAARAGCTTIVLGIGGSACTDGGSGMLRALGAQVLDTDGVPVPPGGGGLVRARHLGLSTLDPHLAGLDIVLACDVDNPLLGPDGAAAVYAPQKGATPDGVARLEAGLAQWASVTAAATGRDCATLPGAGAAGGTGFAALAVLGAAARPGIGLVLELTGFAQALAGAHLVITGEGRLDPQTLHGKAPAGVAAAARASGVPVVAVAGQVTLSSAQARQAGFAAAYALTGLHPDPAVCIARAGDLLEDLTATRVAPGWLSSRDVRSGHG